MAVRRTHPAGHGGRPCGAAGKDGARWAHLYWSSLAAAAGGWRRCGSLHRRPAGAGGFVRCFGTKGGSREICNAPSLAHCNEPGGQCCCKSIGRGGPQRQRLGLWLPGLRTRAHFHGGAPFPGRQGADGPGRLSGRPAQDLDKGRDRAHLPELDGPCRAQGGCSPAAKGRQGCANSQRRECTGRRRRRGGWVSVFPPCARPIPRTHPHGRLPGKGRWAPTGSVLRCVWVYTERSRHSLPLLDYKLEIYQQIHRLWSTRASRPCC